MAHPSIKHKLIDVLRNDGHEVKIREDQFDDNLYKRVTKADKDKKVAEAAKAQKAEKAASSRRQMTKDGCPAKLSAITKDEMLVSDITAIQALPEYKHMEGKPTQKNEIIDAILAVRTRCS